MTVVAYGAGHSAGRVAGPGDGCRSPGPAHGRYWAHGRLAPTAAACPVGLARTATATVAVTVSNVAPRVAGGPDVKVRAGASVTRTCRFADPGADCWKGWVEYGDGSARRTLRLRAEKTFRLSHRFAGPRGRRCTVTLCVTDGDGGRGVDRFSVAVR